MRSQKICSEIVCKKHGRRKQKIGRVLLKQTKTLSIIVLENIYTQIIYILLNQRRNCNNVTRYTFSMQKDCVRGLSSPQTSTRHTVECHTM